MQKPTYNPLIMNSSVLDIVIIGAGHAGLSLSFFLNRLQINHMVFEKGNIGETWRSQRWNSFKLNTPIKVNLLPGTDNTLTDAEGFWTAREFVSLLEDYVKIFRLPVYEGCEVLSVEKIPDLGLFSVTVSDRGYIKKYVCKEVIAASGFQNRKYIPGFSGSISRDIMQLHAADYKNPSSLPDGGVVVIGSAQSGVQIAEELADAGRSVYLSTSTVGRMPRRYRGRDIVDWLIQTGYFDVHTSEVSDPAMLKARFPQISGVGKQGHTVSLQYLARKGVTILGRAINADSTALFLKPDVVGNIKFADEASGRIKAMIDQYISKSGSEAPLPEEDAADKPDEKGESASTEPILDLRKQKISSVIWTTGFNGDFSYIKLPVADGAGKLRHNEGVSDVEGLYFLGIPWMRKRKSGIILGIREDAEFIARKIFERYPGVTGKGKHEINKRA